MYGEGVMLRELFLLLILEMMFGVGVDEIQETDQTQPSSPPILVWKSCETKLQNIADIQTQVVQLKHKLQSLFRGQTLDQRNKKASKKKMPQRPKGKEKEPFAVNLVKLYVILYHNYS